MFILTRNSAKRVRSSSTESESSISSMLCSPPMMRKKWRQASGGSLLSDGSFDSMSRQVSRESNMSDMSSCADNGGNGCLEDVIMETNQEADMETCYEEIPSKRALREVTCELLKEIDPSTKFDTESCVVTAVSFNAKGDILVSDSGNRKVKKFDNLGQLKVECSIPDSYGTFVEPAGLCTTKTGEIVVADRGAGDVKVFTAEGRFLTRFGRDLSKPCDVVSNSQGHVVIVDEGYNDIFVYRSLMDKGVIKINKETNGQKLHQVPRGVTIAKDDEIIVTDYETNSIFCYNSFGQYISEYSVSDNQSSGATNGEGDLCKSAGYVHPVLSKPLGVSNDRDNYVLVVDSGNSRVVRLDLRMNSLTKEIISNVGAPDSSTPTRIATSYQGQMAVIGSGSNLVKIYKYLEND